MARLDTARTAFLLVDMQNEFLHPDGAYARGGATAPAIAALPARLKPVADAYRAAGAWIVSTHFTLVPGKGGEPFISEHLRELRPFLGAGDFAPGSFGHDLIDELQPVDMKVEKVAYSAFYMSRLEWVLRRAGIDFDLRGPDAREPGARCVAPQVPGAQRRGFLGRFDQGVAVFRRREQIAAPVHQEGVVAL